MPSCYCSKSGRRSLRADCPYNPTVILQPSPAPPRACAASAMSKFFEAHPMLLFALEAGVALFLLIFIVVWTMGTAKKNPRPTRAPSEHPSRQPAQGSAEAPPQDQDSASRQ
ncbi:membrane-bound lytic murein transglycosylase A [Cupriavidus necator N-1]|uniref:Membrane-bound lytic murein transglycosylase A n=2 Tax=Burkholderiaceae TaxID=119060 RepID=G0EXC2_CUPNN|nr:membrane-bound lytic murein transglycosylase A [Cupriavidus necator N-1]